ncbi:hypothetical protein [Streptomyces sp. NPDC051665]|uniref:hypothetical protein n=1 Tax=Streptomyces sp. NPDC051665 TaxID=3154647 RepID=UPI00341CC792
MCGNCKTAEGQGKEFLALAGSIWHLLQCNDCRARHALPRHHRLAALRRHLHRERGADGCDWPIHVCVLVTEAAMGGYACKVRC